MGLILRTRPERKEIQSQTIERIVLNSFVAIAGTKVKPQGPLQIMSQPLPDYRQRTRPRLRDSQGLAKGNTENKWQTQS